MFRYYGIDWISVMAGMVSMHAIGSKKRYGFIFGMTACMTSVVFSAFFTHSAAYSIQGAIGFCLQFRGYTKWGGKSTQLAAIRRSRILAGVTGATSATGKRQER